MSLEPKAGPKIIVSKDDRQDNDGDQEEDDGKEVVVCGSDTDPVYDGDLWNLSGRRIDSSVSLSQFSVATTNTAEASSLFFDPGAASSSERLGQMSPSAGVEDKKDKEEDEEVEEEERRQRQASSLYYGSTLINEKHVNFVLMYDMLTGIRIAMSSCQAKPSRPLTDRDFSQVEKLGFDPEGNETTPSSRFEFKFKDYAPWVFRYIREASKIDAADYLVSLTGKYALSEMGSSGKSGSFFYYSQDLRFIIKTIRRSEHIFLRRILRFYYEHLRTNPNSLLTRIFGLHRLRMSSTRKIYFVVMGNIFPPNKEVHEVYDLKGSTQGRQVPPEKLQQPGGKLVTLKDLNWIGNGRKLILGPAKATLLMNQLRADCQFLAKLNIMDYSLLVGLHSIPKGNTGKKSSVSLLEPSGESHHQFKRSHYSLPIETADLPREKRFSEFYADQGGFRSTLSDNSPADGELYFLGIIDILTPYDSKKKVEHVFKSLQFDKSSISAVSPAAYCKRFLQFMADNIIQDKEADYANKRLPEVPHDYALDEDLLDGTVIVNNT